MKQKYFEIAASARQNAENIDMVLIKTEGVDPKKLTCDSVIYGIKVVPITDEKDPDLPTTRKLAGVREVVVGVIDGISKKDVLIVNGKIEIPRASGSLVKLENLYVEDQEIAEDIVRGLLQVELEEAMLQKKALDAEIEVLKKNIRDDRV